MFGSVFMIFFFYFGHGKTKIRHSFLDFEQFKMGRRVYNLESRNYHLIYSRIIIRFLNSFTGSCGSNSFVYLKVSLGPEINFPKDMSSHLNNNKLDTRTVYNIDEIKISTIDG